VIGATLAHYRITAALGAGGMGEVWRAEDERLGREVALKVLPAEVADDPDRLARFEREAKVLASLNHPNIAHLYGLESAVWGDGGHTELEGVPRLASLARDDGGEAAYSEGHAGREGVPRRRDPADRSARDDVRPVMFLVMELVEGKGLDEVIAEGAVPVDEAIPIALQIAEALEAAHEAGIVHRDLKPANVKIRPDGTVKVLDFWETGDADSSLSLSPTLTQHATAAGVILGTAAYMSPEQARGKPADRRADIWAFGVVVWEMLTGAKLFAGETVTDVLASVLRQEPDLDALPADTPPAVRRLVARCLERDPRSRLQWIGDARLELSEPESPAIGDHPAIPSRNRWIGPAVGALGLLAAATAVGWAVLQRPPPVTRRPVHVDVARAGFKEFSNTAISPDGQWLAYCLNEDDTDLQLRSLTSFDVRSVPGTPSIENPFFSPDGSWVAYFDPVTDGIGMVSLAGGNPTRLPGITVATSFRTGAWHPDGFLVFSSAVIDGRASNGLAIASVSGGDATALTTPGPDQVYHHEPHVVPGGDWVLYTVETAQEWEVWAVSFATRETKRVVSHAATPQVVGSSHLLVYRYNQRDVVAYRFDVGAATIAGEPVVVLQNVGWNPRDGGRFAVSHEGTLIYSPVDDANIMATSRSVAWVDRQGTVEQVVAERSSWAQPRLSPDGRRLVVRKVLTPDCSLWTYDLERQTLTRISFEDDTHDPLWDPSGDAVIYAGGLEPTRELHRIAADGSGAPEIVMGAEVSLRAASWSANGGLLALGARGSNLNDDIWVLDSAQGGKPRPFLDSRFSERFPDFSPDGRWLAYASDESGRWEVYVRPYPGPGGRVQVSSDGGLEPLWSGDGRELFYRTSSAMMAVPVGHEDGRLGFGRPHQLFEDPYMRPSKISPDIHSYDVAPDGSRFLMIQRQDQGTAEPDLRVVIGWLDSLDLE
jgi:serine/threonine-protein kinase